MARSGSRGRDRRPLRCRRCCRDGSGFPPDPARQEALVGNEPSRCRGRPRKVLTRCDRHEIRIAVSSITPNRHDMTPFEATVLGVIQGLSEFLPISSSAHLTLAPWLFGWEDPGLAFDVALHFGTLLAVLWYFRVEWVALVKAAFGIVTTGRVETPEKRRVIYLIVATIPGAIGGLLLQSKAESEFRSPQLIAIALIAM